MNSVLKILCILTISVAIGTFHASSQASLPSLVLVQILYRHGDRSPNHFFPMDINNDYWTDGEAQLTNVIQPTTAWRNIKLGKQQHYALGQYIKQRYSGFLNESYDKEEILIMSTDVDRTLMSAYCNLAGLYAPFGNQVWDKNIAWQPIPVHTRPTEIDYIVEPDAYCPKNQLIVNKVKKSPQVQHVNEENKDLFAFVTNQTGYNVTDIFSLATVHDALFCDKCHNLTVPDWVEPIWGQMEYLHNLEMYYTYGLPAEYRLTGGPLVGHMIENMQAKMEDVTSKQKAYVFSSHDTKLVAYLSVLDTWNMLAPPYAATVLVELHKLTDGNYGVQVLYRNDTSVDPYMLDIPTCGVPCPIEDFIRLSQDSIPDDIAKECILIEE